MSDPAALPRLGPLPADPLTAGPLPAPDVPRRAWVEQVMGMPVSFHVRGPLVRDDDGPVGAAIHTAIAELHRVDEIFSTYRPGSQLSRLRRGELAAVDCDPWMAEVIELCRAARSRTDGWFDADLPDAQGVRRFDPTGLVKGWAIERVTRALSAAATDHDVLVNAGGDVAVRCRRTDTPDWLLGVEDPADRTRLLATVPMRSGGMATSGSAARGAHIVDPHRGEPIARAGSVTVIGPDLMWADVHATAAFAMGPAAEHHLARLPGHLSFIVRPDGTTRTLTGPEAGSLPPNG